MILQVFLTFVGFSYGQTVPGYIQGYVAQQVPQSYFHPRDLHLFQENAINQPLLGLSPQQHNFVYKYITDYAGNDTPPQVKVADIVGNEAKKEENAGESIVTKKDKEEEVKGYFGQATEKPGLEDYLLPSDFILLRHAPEGQLFGNIGDIKMRRQNFKSNSKTGVPLGGVLSNYVLMRSRPDFQNFPPFSTPSSSDDNQVSKRQATSSDDVDDTVVINAENPHNVKMNEEEGQKDKGMTDDEENEEYQPAIAQSKPAAIALAGPGGVAQASPVGTALVGPGGLAVAAPSGTAVAGPAGQGAIPHSADDKTKIVQKKIKEVWN